MAKYSAQFIFVSWHPPSSSQGEDSSGFLTEQKGPFQSVSGDSSLLEMGTLSLSSNMHLCQCPPTSKSWKHQIHVEDCRPSVLDRFMST